MKVVISGILGIEGSWDLDVGNQPLTNGELHTIKKISGIRAGEIEEAFSAGDNDLMVSLASIALTRAGKPVPIHVLWDAPAGSSIVFTDDDPEPAGEGAADEPVPPPADES